jgi:hypothetical protein
VQLATNIHDPLPAARPETPPGPGQGATLALGSGAGQTAHRASVIDVQLLRPLFAVAAVGVFSALATVAVLDRQKALGVAIGALLATTNLWVFARIGAAALHRDGAGFPYSLLAPLKLAALFAVVIAVLETRVAGPIEFLAGYLALPVGIVVAQLLARRTSFEHRSSSY